VPVLQVRGIDDRRIVAPDSVGHVLERREGFHLLDGEHVRRAERAPHEERQLVQPHVIQLGRGWLVTRVRISDEIEQAQKVLAADREFARPARAHGHDGGVARHFERRRPDLVVAERKCQRAHGGDRGAGGDEHAPPSRRSVSSSKISSALLFELPSMYSEKNSSVNCADACAGHMSTTATRHRKTETMDGRRGIGTPVGDSRDSNRAR
jgi:hypothetical protein